MGLVAAKLRERGTEATVESCGVIDQIREGTFFKTASKNSIAVLAARGIDISAHRPRHFSDFDLAAYDKIIVVTEEVKWTLVEYGAPPERIVILNEAAGGLVDPHGKEMPAYEECVATIEAELDRLLADLKV